MVNDTARFGIKARWLRRPLGAQDQVYDLRLLFRKVAGLQVFQEALRKKGGPQPWIGKVTRSAAKPGHFFASANEVTAEVRFRVLGVNVHIHEAAMLTLHEVAHACSAPWTSHSRPWRELYMAAARQMFPGIIFQEPPVKKCTNRSKYPLDRAILDGIGDWLRRPENDQGRAFDDCLMGTTTGLTYNPQPVAGSLRIRAGGAAGTALLEALMLHSNPRLSRVSASAKVREIETVFDIPGNALKEVGVVVRHLADGEFDERRGRAFRRIAGVIEDALMRRSRGA